MSKVAVQEGIVTARLAEKTCTLGLPNVSKFSLVSTTSSREKNNSTPISWLMRISALLPRTVLGLM